MTFAEFMAFAREHQARHPRAKVPPVTAERFYATVFKKFREGGVEDMQALTIASERLVMEPVGDLKHIPTLYAYAVELSFHASGPRDPRYQLVSDREHRVEGDELAAAAGNGRTEVRLSASEAVLAARWANFGLSIWWDAEGAAEAKAKAKAKKRGAR